MRPISPKIRKQLASDPFMQKCAYGCNVKPEWEHALIYQGKQVNEWWAIIPLCTHHHRGHGLNKRYNEYIALSRASEADLMKYSKANWKQKLIYLKGIYGL